MSTLLAEFDKAVDELRYRVTGVVRSDQADDVVMTSIDDKRAYLVLVGLLQNVDRAKANAVLVDAVEKLTRAAINAANANAVEERLLELQTVNPWRFVKKRRLVAKLADYRQMEAENRRDAQIVLLAWAKDCRTH